MRSSLMICAALALASVASAQTPVTFKRPDCSAYSASLKPERTASAKRTIWKEANFAALQKTELMFVYMARPDPRPAPTP